MATTTATQIQQLYVGLLGRAADQGGLNWWADQVTTGGKTLEDVRASFVTSTEYTTTYGAAATRADLVTSIYQNLFERTPSADEVKYWAETDTRPADQLVAAFIEFAGAADQAVINNKTFVAQTYTDTVGATNFDKAAATTVIASVDGTPASVTTAINTITSGSLPGLTPGVNLISALNAANAAKDAYAKQIAAEKPAFDTKLADGTAGKDGAVSFDEAKAALQTATTARTDALQRADGSLIGDESVAMLAAQKSDAATAAAAAKTAALAVTVGASTGTVAQKAIADYDAAVAAKLAAVQTPAQVKADTAAQAAALAGVKASITATSEVKYSTLAAKVTTTSSTDVATIVDEATLYAALKSEKLNAVEHANLVAEVSKIPTFGSALVASAEKKLAATKLTNAVTAAETEVKKIDSDGALTVKHEGQDYIDKAVILTEKTAAVTAADSSEAAIVAAKAVVDQYTTLNKAATDASTAISTFNGAAENVGKVAITLTGTTEGTAAKDVFFFPSKIVGTNDFAIGTTTAFGAGDAIVLGSGYTFNSGALTTGNNSALEVFFVKGATGTQVVVESNAVGSATAVTGTDGTVTTHNDVAVINLVGVTADHLSFNNGVVSYV